MTEILAWILVIVGPVVAYYIGYRKGQNDLYDFWDNRKQNVYDFYTKRRVK